jgi:branched-chain amino acid transport system substrate-binding protein
MNIDRRTAIAGGLALATLPWLPGCAKRPVSIGFLGGLTGPASDLGVAGRDGVQLAIEQANAAGGLNGQPIGLVEVDDRQQADSMPVAAQRMQAEEVAAVIGPMTSSMAAHWIPLANQAGLLTVSPTVTSTDFSGQDDHFFRVCSTTRDYASISAEHHVRQGGWKRYAVVRDDSNAAYTRSWAEHFATALNGLGAEVVHQQVYRLGSQSESLAPFLQMALAYKPDALVVVANAIDTANIAQLLRKENKTLPMLSAEWAATEQLIELGGRAVQGLHVAQYFDRQGQQPVFVAFRQAFMARYGRQPGFAEVGAFDATSVVLQAIRQRQGNETLRDAVRRIRPFDGLQQSIVFDNYGDASRKLYITRIENGRYMVAS